MTDPATCVPVACPPKTEAEELRLAALHGYSILDTPRESAFDDITRIAALICEVPIAVVNLIDRERQWFKSEIGLGVRETPLATSICAHAILQQDLFVVPDTLQDSRFVNNPLVTGDPRLRFYAGALLKTPDGQPLGTVCVLDMKPRQLRPEQTEALQALARQTMAQLELRRMLALAQESSRYRSRLMAIAGHDLRTPLRAASYAIDKVRRKLDEETGAPLKVAQEAIGQVHRDFDQLASVAGTEGELSVPDMVDFPISEVLDPVLASWRRQAEMKGITLRARPSSLRVRSHHALLATVLGNLLGNAVKYTTHGSVLIGCRRRGDKVIVEIVDTGIGMDDAQTTDLFGAFRQADPRSDGLGLGLWIVRQTAETLGCPVTMRSRKGHGSRFTVTVPRA
jgi:signal transduction histidine kinase